MFMEWASPLLTRIGLLFPDMLQTIQRKDASLIFHFPCISDDYGANTLKATIWKGPGTQPRIKEISSCSLRVYGLME